MCLGGAWGCWWWNWKDDLVKLHRKVTFQQNLKMKWGKPARQLSRGRAFHAREQQAYRLEAEHGRPAAASARGGRGGQRMGRVSGAPCPKRPKGKGALRPVCGPLWGPWLRISVRWGILGRSGAERWHARTEVFTLVRASSRPEGARQKQRRCSHPYGTVRTSFFKTLNWFYAAKERGAE